ncbi:hypothetical protein OR16_21156 [Cupriavidus basilensis OR16]|uniref:Uncharacterized protein n=1 Tax=Cupriavidus basilensis OR16 TaxID=1127483 RepID=H1S8C8_9BURK|nr:hypothetical protein [Cupriavidus basilensis]EHP41248.1 hypothetical protein OR16_21156 [Cupriavidus basilensis OR16]
MNAKCPKCGTLTDIDAYHTHPNGKREGVYRCFSRGCWNTFMRPVNEDSRRDAGTETFSHKPKTVPTIKTDC